MSVFDNSVCYFLKNISLLLLITFIASCASVEVSQCINADWYAVGVEDGSAGKLLNVELAKHTKACTKVNVMPEQHAYESGHHEGLLRYCTYLNGLELGQKGHAMSIQCPEESGDEFVRGYAKGREILRARRTINALEVSISDKQALLDDISSQVDHKQALLQHENDSTVRGKVINDIKRLRLDRQLISQELHRARNQRQGTQQVLETMLNPSAHSAQN